MSQVKITGTVQFARRSEQVNHHRPTAGVSRDRLAYDEQGNVIGVLEYTRWILIRGNDGRNWLWFGKPETKWWSHFSSKASSPIQEGDSITLVASPKMVDGQPKVYPEGTHTDQAGDEWTLPQRTVIQRPQLVTD